MAELTGQNLVNSVMDSAGITAIAAYGPLVARLQQMITQGTQFNQVTASIVLLSASLELRNAVSDMATLSAAVKTNMDMIEAAVDQAAVDALDFPDINGGSSTEVTLDNQGTIDPEAPWSTNAANGDYVFIDTAAQGNNAIINNFGSGDRIQLENSSQNNISVSNDGADVVILNNNGGTISQITLVGIVDSSQTIYDANSLEQALGYTVFNWV